MASTNREATPARNHRTSFPSRDPTAKINTHRARTLTPSPDSNSMVQVILLCNKRVTVV